MYSGSNPTSEIRNRDLRRSRPPEQLLQVVHFGGDLLLAEECDSLQRGPKHPRATGNTYTFGTYHHRPEGRRVAGQQPRHRVAQLANIAIT
ncbi:hypothetical protein BRADI_5g22675v3 [Brachypodium distachyon]|uniref:Uncharacterized protein n=1 Tax=Brachypodium distachyon TaxID=15368 RepID=A0A2K2CIP5_BRADI|nr:hypothetical protein BRADI_5g22675v3 [Brachypodium distachyon]